MFLSLCELIFWAIVFVLLHFGLALSLAMHKLWSLPISSFLYALTSCTNDRYILLIHMRSIWFLVWSSREFYVTLWISLCWDVVLLIHRSKTSHSSMSLSPFWLSCPIPWVPMVLSTPILSFPILALKSPITRSKSWKRFYWLNFLIDCRMFVLVVICRA